MNFCSKGEKKQFIAIKKFGATWTDNENKFKVTFNKASLKLAINFLLDNCFFSLVNLSFRKMTGISMDSDQGPWVNLWQIYFYNIVKNKWLLDTKKRFK